MRFQIQQYSVAKKHATSVQELSYRTNAQQTHNSWTRLDVFIKQDQEREQGIQLPVSYTLSDHRICHGVRPFGRYVKNWRFSSSSLNCMSMDSIIEVFYHLNKMLIATELTLLFLR